MRTVRLDFSGLRLRLTGLPERLAAEVEARSAPFVGGADGPAFLELRVTYDDAPTPPPEGYSPKTMAAETGAGAAVFSMPEGELRLRGAEPGRVTLRRGLGNRESFTLANLLRAALAWRLPDRGGALVHAAAVALDERAFLLVGAEGAGKSTWADLAERGGAHVISDDLVIVDGGEPPGAAPLVLGSPLRSTHRGPLRHGRWPLAALLLPRRSPVLAPLPAPGLIARAGLTANLPFVAAGLERDARIGAVVESLLDRVPCLSFPFALDDDGVVARLRALGSTGG